MRFLRTYRGVNWAARFAVPLLLPAVFYWWTLDAWFRADDFAWLSQGLTVQTLADWPAALFEPRAQGTVRFLSERLFFLSFWKGFELDALPYRLAVMLLLSGSCLWLSELARLLRRERWVPAVVTIFWLSQAGLAASMGWLSAANQVWCAFFLLGGLLAFARGRMWLCLAAFLAGVGTLETMAMLPVLAIAWAMLIDRTRLKAAIWLLLPAAGYAAVNFLLIPKTATDPAYRLSLDPIGMARHGVRYVSFLPIVAGLALPVAWGLWRRSIKAALGPLAFFILLAPVLPLTQKFELYYLALPSAALAMGLAAVEWPVALVAAGAALAMRPSPAEDLARSEEVRVLVRGVREARRLHPESAILLTGISNRLFWDGMFDDPFRLAGVDRVYLAPGAEAGIDPHPEWGGIGRWLVPPVTASGWMDDGTAQVYQPVEKAIQNVTGRYTAGFGRALASEIDIGDPASAGQLGEGWHALENRSRWMRKRAAVRLNLSRGSRIELSGFCAAAGHPAALIVRIGGVEAGQLTPCVNAGPFSADTAIPAAARGLPEAVVTLEATSLVMADPNAGELAVVFGRIAVRD